MICFILQAIIAGDYDVNELCRADGKNEIYFLVS